MDSNRLIQNGNRPVLCVYELRQIVRNNIMLVCIPFFDISEWTSHLYFVSYLLFYPMAEFNSHKTTLSTLGDMFHLIH